MGQKKTSKFFIYLIIWAFLVPLHAMEDSLIPSSSIEDGHLGANITFPTLSREQKIAGGIALGLVAGGISYYVYKNYHKKPVAISVSQPIRNIKKGPQFHKQVPQKELCLLKPVDQVIPYPMPIAAEVFLDQFQKNRDMSDVENLAKSEWKNLCGSTEFNEFILNSRFCDRMNSDMPLYIKVIRVADKTVAFLTFHQQKDVHKGHMDLLAVHEKFRGKRYATILLTHAEEIFKKAGIKDVDIWVFHENKLAQKIYEHLGYTLKSNSGIWWIYEKKIN